MEERAFFDAYTKIMDIWESWQSYFKYNYVMQDMGRNAFTILLNNLEEYRKRICDFPNVEDEHWDLYKAVYEMVEKPYYSGLDFHDSKDDQYIEYETDENLYDCYYN